MFDLDKVLETIKATPEQKVQAYLIFQSGVKNKVRLGVAHGGNSVLMYIAGSRKYGYALTPRFISSWEIVDIKVVAPPDPAIVWEKSWRKALAMLDESDWWHDVRNNIRTALDIGYEGVQEGYVMYRSLPWEGRDEEFKAKADERFILAGKHIRETILYHMAEPAIIKKMYFGKYDNEETLKHIKDFIEDEWSRYQRSTKRIYNGRYDVQFTFDPMTKRAWYNEEYKDCGNGHYYLALSGTHALFWEDD